MCVCISDFRSNNVCMEPGSLAKTGEKILIEHYLRGISQTVVVVEHPLIRGT